MRVRVLYDFSGASAEELSVALGEELTILDQTVGEGWWSAVTSAGRTGLIPSSYVEPIDPPEPNVQPPPPPAIFVQHQWNEEWDSDDSLAQPTTDNTSAVARPDRMGSSISVESSTQSDSARRNAVRKGFAKYGAKSGFEEFLLRIEEPENIHPIMYIDFTDGLFCWRPIETMVSCKVGDFAKSSKMRGMKSFVNYRLTSSLIPSHVDRRYKQFDWLHARLSCKCPPFCIPSLPEKTLTSVYTQEFLEDRRNFLQRWLDWCCSHPVVCRLTVFRHFLSAVDEKRWKQGKREAEADRLQSIRFFFSIQSPEGPVPEDSTYDSVDQMDKFSNELLSVIRNFGTTIAEFHRRMSVNCGKDFHNLAEAFFSMSRVLDTDVHSKKLVGSMVSVFSNVGESVKSVGLHQSVRPESVAPLSTCLQDYSNLLSNLPSVTTLGRSACITMEEAKRLEAEGKLSKSDLTNILTGCRVITRSVQAECNLIMSRLRQDFTKLFGDYLRDQVTFYRKMADQLEGAALLFRS